jgi:non-homologous end joining protein Ku
MQKSQRNGEEIPKVEIVRWVPIQQVKYVIVDEDDLMRANVKKPDDEIVAFVKEAEVDLRFLGTNLQPQKRGKASTLLREARLIMEKRNCRYVMRRRDHLALIRLHNRLSYLTT